MVPKPVRALVALVVIGGGGYAAWRLSRPAPEPEGIIKGSGTIEATEIMVGPKIGGRIVDLRVEEGSVVRRGDLIAVLDTRELSAQVGQAQAAQAVAQARLDAGVAGSRPEQIAAARASLAQAQAAVAGGVDALANARKNLRKVTDLKAQDDAARSRLEAAQAALAQAEEALRLVKAGPREQQVEQACAAVTQAEVALKKAESDAKRIQALHRDGAVSAQQLDAADAARDSARSQLDQAKAHVADLLAGARPEEVRQAEYAVTQAKANLDGAKLAAVNAREALEDRLATKTQADAARASLDAARAQERAARAQLDLLVAGTRAEDIRALRDQVSQAKEQLRLASAQRGNAYVYAPADGVIKTKTAELGETVAAGSPIVDLLDAGKPWLRVYVPEARYGQVGVGQKAEVTVDSYPGQTFQGTVVEIASEPEFTPKNVQTQEERVKLVFGVKVLLDGRDGRLKAGMPADAVIRVK